jgi:hypothetical protein
MNRALHKMTDEERETIVEQDKVILTRVLAEIAPRGDMEQIPEPEERREWNPVALMVLTYAAVLAVVIGWIAAERMF